MIVTRIGPMSAARIAGVLYALMGLIFGLFISVATGAGMMAPTGNTNGGLAGGMMLGAAAVFVLPILYGFFGFLTTLIGAATYNALAGTVGGIEIETREKQLMREAHD
jgi:hypothetical protein